MSSDRDWMYTMRTTSNGVFNPSFMPHVNRFLDFAFTNTPSIQSQVIEGVEVSVIRCPCAKCKNRRFKTREEIEGHLYKKGFMDDYKVWHVHGESLNTQGAGQCSNPVPSQQGPQDPKETAEKVNTASRQSNEPLWDGSKHTRQSAATRLLDWKSEHDISDSSFNELLMCIKEALPRGNRLPRNFDEAKKILR